MDVSKLLEPREGDAVSGENLEYDPEFVEMELAAQPGEERQEGDKIIEAEDADFAEVVKLAQVVLERSHDIRAAVFYAEGILHTKGLPGFAEATAYIRGCLENHWDTCHPELDEDDDNDPTMRINAVQGLSGSSTVIRALRQAPLTESRMFGRMSLRMMEIADGTVTPSASMTDVPDTAAVNAAFQDSDTETLQAILAAVGAAKADIAAIDAVFTEKTPGQGPSFDEVNNTLNQITRRMTDAMGVEIAGGEAVAEEAGGEAGPAVATASGAINSATDVTNALDRIISYYQRAEPSSPVPMLLERAKRLVSADFMTIIQDIAPVGIDQTKIVGGIKD
ncbi:Type VI secretion-associated protein, ImpA family [Sulfitobacter noctilucicola]|uniref:Type VI secretion system protein ImpA n=1 Tax=Sulfitobacter noctilucicola TaxID=1342301 RepID=A0A7W6MBM5_9RHOB|nr:type VI secretion system protein TssA [Sulfitobacter noctilucicola]KIN70002.1 Type VI secretion-associated protein, ImpA family [Sulfitobacter noctilucicola]MBB4176014.1 type VI secretion system protein ImpA [Sulfitobacter noctilucicola]